MTSPVRSKTRSSFHDFLSDATTDFDNDDEGDETLLTDEDQQQQRLQQEEEPYLSSPPADSPNDTEYLSPPSNKEELYHHNVLLSPFSPECVRPSKRDLVVDTSTSSVTWKTQHFNEESCLLSLANERVVSLVVHVRDPPRKNAQSPIHGEQRLPCVFPVEAFSQEASSDNNPLSSPTSVALANAEETKKLVLVRPDAFPKNVSNKVFMEILRKIRGKRMTSEDWAREFCFDKVFWPKGAWSGLARLASAVAQDLTAPASIANRILFNHGQPGKEATLFGTSMRDNIAEAFARPTIDPDNDDWDIAKAYGIVGLMLNKLLKYKNETNSQIVIGLSMLEVTASRVEGLRDLFREYKSSRRGDTVRLVSTGNDGGELENLIIVDVDSLKSLGQQHRRAFTMVRDHERGHIISSVYLYRNKAEFGKTSRIPVAHFVDMASPTAINPADNMIDTRKESILKCETNLCTLLRAKVLEQAGSNVALPFRGSLLTRVLQKSISHQDSKIVLLTSISAMLEHRERTLRNLNFSSSIIKRSGEPPKSPFERNFRMAAGTNGTSPTSQLSDISETLSFGELPLDYHKQMLPMLTGDPRQRLSKAGFHQPTTPNAVYVKGNHTEISGGTLPTTTTGEDEQHQYLELDPDDFDENHEKPDRPQQVNSRRAQTQFQTPMSSLPTPQMRNLSSTSQRPHPEDTGRMDNSVPGAAEAYAFDTSMTLDSMEQGSLPSSERARSRDRYPTRSTKDAKRPSVQSQNSLSTGSRLTELHNDYGNPDMHQLESEQTDGYYEGQMDDLSFELRQKAAMETNDSFVDDQAMEDLSLELKEKARENERTVRQSYSPRSPEHDSSEMNTESSFQHRLATSRNQQVRASLLPPKSFEARTASEISIAGTPNPRTPHEQLASANSVVQYAQDLRRSEQILALKISAERDELRKEVDRLTRELGSEVVLRKEKEQEMEDLNKIAEDAVKACETEKGRHDKVHAEKEKLERSLRYAEDQLRKSRADETDQMADLYRALQSLKDEGEQVRARDAKQIAELEDQLRQEMSKVESLKHEMACMENDFQVHRMEMKEDLERAEGDRDVAMADMRESVARLEELQNENYNLRQELSGIQASFQERDEKIASLETKVEDLEYSLQERSENVLQLVENAKESEHQYELAETLKREAETLKRDAEVSLETLKEKERIAHDRRREQKHNLDEALLKGFRAQTSKQVIEPLQKELELEKERNRFMSEDLQYATASSQALEKQNEDLRARIAKMRQEVRENDERYFEQHRPLEPQVCQRCNRQPIQALLGENPSKEDLENLVLTMSLRMKELPPGVALADLGKSLLGVAREMGKLSDIFHDHTAYGMEMERYQSY